MPEDTKAAAPTKVKVRFLKQHRLDHVDHDEGDVIGVHPNIAKLLTRVPPVSKPGEEPEQQVAELVVDKPAATVGSK